MKKSSWILMATTLMLGLQSLPVLPAAAADITAQELIKRLNQPTTGMGFKGKRTLKVTRHDPKTDQDIFQIATADIVYADRNNYDLHITGPMSILNIDFNMKNGVNSVYFPDEQLFLTQGGQNTSYMPERVILGSFSPRTDLLQQNYEIKILKEHDNSVAITPAYVVEFVPKNTAIGRDGKTRIAMVPRRRYWLDETSMLVLKEERYWDSVTPDGKWNFSPSPYAVGYYDQYQKIPKPIVPALAPTGQVNKVVLSGKEKNSFLTYKTAAEAAKAEGIKISEPPPAQMPKGFVLKDIQVFTLFGARIQILNYTDGLNDMMITIRPKQNAFVTLMAGAFSLSLIKKISDLSAQAPNNYYSNESDKSIGVVFGDMHPDVLYQVATSMTY